MLKIKIEWRASNAEAIALELEHTADLIRAGWASGRSWEIKNIDNDTKDICEIIDSELENPPESKGVDISSEERQEGDF